MPKKQEQKPIPDKIEVLDDYGQKWEVTPQDKLWGKVLQEHQAGNEIVVIPLREIAQNKGFGWWTVLESIKKWMAEMNMPPHPDMSKIPPPDAMSPVDLNKLLVEYGAHLSRLEGAVGLLQGKYIALKEGLATGMAVATAKIDEPKVTEKSKEAKVMAGSETLRQTRRMQIETEAVLAAAKGMRDAYQRAWETVSRLISLWVNEATISGGRG